MSNRFFAIGVIAVATLNATGTVQGEEMAMHQTKADAAKLSAADKKMIASAMQAAPRKVGAGATIIAMNADGKMRTLREGNNGFTCMPDNPATPGP
jgi:hypothetical protein